MHSRMSMWLILFNFIIIDHKTGSEELQIYTQDSGQFLSVV